MNRPTSPKPEQVNFYSPPSSLPSSYFYDIETLQQQQQQFNNQEQQFNEFTSENNNKENNNSFKNKKTNSNKCFSSSSSSRSSSSSSFYYKNKSTKQKIEKNEQNKNEIKKQNLQNSIIIRQNDTIKKQLSFLYEFFSFFISSYDKTSSEESKIFDFIESFKQHFGSFFDKNNNETKQNKNKKENDKNVKQNVEQQQQQPTSSSSTSTTTTTKAGHFLDHQAKPFCPQQMRHIENNDERTISNAYPPQLPSYEQSISPSLPSHSYSTENHVNVVRQNEPAPSLSPTTAGHLHRESSSTQLPNLDNRLPHAPSNVTTISKEEHQQEEGRSQHSPHLRQGTSNDAPSNGSRNFSSGSNHQSLLNRSEQRPPQSSNTSNSFSSGVFDSKSNGTQRCETCSFDLCNVENCEPLRRCGKCHKGVCINSNNKSNRSEMGQTQNQQTESSSSPQLDRHSGGQLPRTSSTNRQRPSESSELPRLPNNNSSSSSSQQQQQQSQQSFNDDATREPINGNRQQQQQQQQSSFVNHLQRPHQVSSSVPANQGTHSSLLQEGCSRSPHQNGRSGSSRRSSINHGDGKTQRRSSRFPNNNSSVRSGPNRLRNDDWYSESDEASLDDFINSFSVNYEEPFLCNFHRNKKQQNTYDKISALLLNNTSSYNPIYIGKNKNEKYFNLPAKQNLSFISSDNSIFHNFQKSIQQNNSSFFSPSTSIFSITKHSHSNTTATPDELQQLPLHVADVPPMNVDKIVEMMNETTTARYNKLVSLLTKPDSKQHHGDNNILEPSVEIEKSFGCLPRHSEILVSKKIVELVDENIHGKTKGSGRVFMVKEAKVDDEGNLKNRLRFIFWPLRMNNWLKKVGYTCEALLYHISKYLDNITDDFGATADAASGFFQYEIPPHARPWFRFMDSDGKVYQLCRLPMGLSLSVELMQLMMEVLIGNPEFVKEEFAITNVRSNAYVDDIRISGPLFNMVNACKNINNRAKDLGITLKSPLELSSSYTFLGAFFDHKNHSISIGEKLKKKIPTEWKSKTIIGKEFHSLIGRLIHATAILRLPLVSFMMLVKWSARKFNQFNKDPKLADSVVTLPDFAVSKLNSWCQLAHSQRFVKNKQHNNNPEKKVLKIFLDASKDGWGATVITPDLQLFHSGGRWNDEEKQLHINLLEALAFRKTVISFADLIISIGAVDFNIDNTSVQFSVARGAARKEEMIKIIQHPIEFLVAFDIDVTSQYVESKNNLSDCISRQNTNLPKLTREEVENIYKRRGAGERW